MFGGAVEIRDGLAIERPDDPVVTGSARQPRAWSIEAGKALSRHPGHRVTTRLLDACQSACEVGEFEAADRLLELAEKLLLEHRPDPTAGLLSVRRGRPPQQQLMLWRDDAELVVAMRIALWERRRGEPNPPNGTAPG
jgi:hypothetical protein